MAARSRMGAATRSWLAVSVLSASGGAVASACLVSIADPAGSTSDGITQSGGGAHAESGAGGDASGTGGFAGSNGGSVGGAGGAAVCDGGAKSCDGRCVAIDDPAFGCTPAGCTPCALQHAASHRCSAGACAVGDCETDRVDCNGDPADGCETDFGVASTAGAVTNGTRFQSSPVVDGSPEDWAGVPQAAMTQTCTSCLPEQPGGHPGERITNAPIGKGDLRSVFRVGWDDLALYVLIAVQDDQVLATDATNPQKQDGAELFLDGAHQGNPNYGPDDHHLFIGALGKNAFEANINYTPSSQELTIGSSIQASCYFVETRITWFYLMGHQAHTPAVGNTYGFTVAANDWDLPDGADGSAVAERQNQLFWVQPGSEYAFSTSGFGDLTLK